MIGVDGRYATPINAHRARMYGLSWMVTTDHGGPNHSKLNLTRAYAELKTSSDMVPEVLQFYGMELNMPAMDHHTLIIPNSEHEASMLYDIESRFDSQERGRRFYAKQEAQAKRALEHMKSLPLLPLMFAEPSVTFRERRRRLWVERAARAASQHNLAPNVYPGMEGAPGHQAGTLAPDGIAEARRGRQAAGSRGGYGNAKAPARSAASTR